MEYEVICEIKNSCSGNQMRDVFFEELEIDDPDAWIRKREVNAASIEREDFPGGIRYQPQGRFCHNPGQCRLRDPRRFLRLF